MGKSPPIKIPIEKWCKLCDLVSLPPDSPIDDLLYIVETRFKELTILRKEQWQSNAK